MSEIKKYPLYQTFLQQIAASQVGSWINARVMHHLDRLTLKLSGGSKTMGNLLTGLPVVEVIATGARSGLPRPVMLLGIRSPEGTDTIALIASNWGQERNPAWYYNLLAHPCVTCKIDGRPGEYIAREASGEEYTRYWKLAVEVYSGYENYRQRVGERHIPIMVLESVAEDQ